jgi:ADP-ribose pyrophosphatase YjhB (NUDIX family)
LYSSGHPSIIDLCIHSSLACKPEDFHFIFSTVEQQIEKPSPHIVFVMMEKYRQLFGKEVGASEALVVGDSVADFLMAKNAGVDFAAVLTGPTTPDDLLFAGLDSKWIFPSVKEALVSPSNHGVVAIIQNEENEFLLIKDGDPKHEYVGYWSGPHGVCNDEDVLEEETVVRETLEECGITVKPLRKLYTQTADTKVSTVSFWEAELTNQKNVTFKLDPREVSEIDWIPYEDIVNYKVPLYPGTKDFFNKYKQIVMKEGEVKI